MEGRDPDERGGAITIPFVVGFYAVLAAVAWGLSLLFADVDLLVWHDDYGTSPFFDAGVAALFGGAVVLTSRVLDRTAEWARELGREFGRLLGRMSVEEVFVIAAASGIGEELLFRGFFQQVLTEYAFGGTWDRWWALLVASVVFGALHVGPDPKKFLPWTIMAVVFGAGFGGIYMYTGNVLGPIVAHFTINFFNLLFIAEKYGGAGEVDG